MTSVDYDRSTNNADSNVDKKGVQPPDGNEPMVVSKTVKINNRDVDKGDHLSSGHEPFGKENSFDTTDSNNHQLSASGLHNEHGVDDNRYTDNHLCYLTTGNDIYNIYLYTRNVNI